MNIYLAQQENTNLYKIGITKKAPHTRLKELQTGNAGTIVLVETFTTKYGFKLESALHNNYRRKNVREEWFELNSEDVASFITTCEKTEKSFDILKAAKNPFF